MRISRLYLQCPLSVGQYKELDDESAHYVRNVLRLKKSASIIVFNGQGGEWSGTVTEVHRKRVTVFIKQWLERNVESSLFVHLGLAVARSDRMDLAMQKSVELGVNKISPLLTERSVVQFKGTTIQRKHRHWRRIVQNAVEQCGRTMLPETEEPCGLADWLTVQSGLKVFLYPYAEMTLPLLKPKNGKITLLCGPEGGFSDVEKDMAIAAGFIPVSMGKRILRTETASLAALAAVQVLWGDFG